MKFHLCGGLDAPDWILSNISTISTIPSGRVKLLVQHIIQKIVEGVFDHDNVMEITADSTLGVLDMRACIAALHFIIANAAKFDVADSTLTRELQQLGLPKEQTDAVVRPFWEHKEAVQAKLLQESLQIPDLQIRAWQAQLGDSKNLVMRLTSSDQEQRETTKDLLVCLPAEKFRVLLHELKSARALMEEFL